MVRSTARTWMVRMSVGLVLMLGEGYSAGKLWAHPPRTSGGKAIAGLEIAFQLHDYAHMSASALSRVESEATRVLLRAGIQSRWNAPVDQEPQGCPVGGKSSHSGYLRGCTSGRDGLASRSARHAPGLFTPTQIGPTTLQGGCFLYPCAGDGTRGTRSFGSITGLRHRPRSWAPVAPFCRAL